MDTFRVAVLHGAGYVARELLLTISTHPAFDLVAVTSESKRGLAIGHAHPTLRGVVEGEFISGDELDVTGIDVVFSCGHHGPFIDEIIRIDDSGFTGVIVDLSANFRLKDLSAYRKFYDFEHNATELLDRFEYGLTERNREALRGARRIANPGCFATGIALSLAPLSDAFTGLSAHVVALTGASGSGITARPTTHFPDRSGNARAYNVWRHRHTPEIEQCMQHPVEINFVPASGPWTHGIWGVCTVTGIPHASDIGALYAEAYGDKPFVRLWPDELPELRYAARTPFCDIGWQKRADGLVIVGFALDNLLKGAATSAIQNANLALGLPETTGLIGQPRFVTP